MGNSHNPLTPLLPEQLFFVLFLAAFVLAVVALWSISRAKNRLSGLEFLAWSAIVLFLPAFGAGAWFWWSRSSQAKNFSH